MYYKTKKKQNTYSFYIIIIRTKKKELKAITHHTIIDTDKLTNQHIFLYVQYECNSTLFRIYNRYNKTEVIYIYNTIYNSYIQTYNTCIYCVLNCHRNDEI